MSERKFVFKKPSSASSSSTTSLPEPPKPSNSLFIKKAPAAPQPALIKSPPNSFKNPINNTTSKSTTSTIAPKPSIQNYFTKKTDENNPKAPAKASILDLDDDWNFPSSKTSPSPPPAPKPVATVRPQQTALKSQRLLTDLSNSPKKNSLPEVTPPKPPAPKHSNDHCPSCQVKYELIDRTSQSRKVTDSCGHNICLSCLLKGEICQVCTQKASPDSPLDSPPQLKPQKAVIEDSPPLLKSKSPQKEPRKSDKFSSYLNGIDLNDIFDDDDGPIEVTHEKKPQLEFAKKPSPVVRKEMVIVDSDDDLIIEEDEQYLNESYNNKLNHKNAPRTSTTPNKPKNMNFNFESMFKEFSFSEEPKNGTENDEDIDEIDDDELLLLSDTKAQKTGAELPYSDIYIPEIESYEKIKWLFNDIKDSSPSYRSLAYPHTKDMCDAFRNLFGLKKFRPQQFEAVNAALLGNNVFILMPTGGGKSLCYQLPAILSNGVTFIVSPLKSLIVDQVQKLNALNLPAAHLLSEESGGSCEPIYQDLSRKEPTLRLIYVTPEKLNNSEKLSRILTGLYSRQLIARLVIDEAHCVSTWGHDFRPDYKQIGYLRQKLFPNVPIMLLTATATPRVRQDILLQMNLLCESEANSQQFQQQQAKSRAVLYHKNEIGAMQKQTCAFFIQSFNRANLQYSVELKTSNKAALDKIAGMIRTKFANKSGIVYCISRNECETVADFLCKNGIKALAYHAGMSDKDRITIQHRWTNNIECKCVCATIAFGMGIDKADVRYVFHLGLPKSLEGYYQESGRAGRDGLISSCILFFNNQDRHKWLRLMKQEQKNSGGNYEVFKVHLDNLYRMSQYCDNRTDCRRAQILEYFGEIFDRQKCIDTHQTTCDNCTALKENAFTMRDITDVAMSIVKGVRELNGSDLTLLHIAEVLKGSMNSKVVEKGHQNLEMHGKLAKYKKTDIERIIRRLIFQAFLKEDVKILQHTDTVASYIKMGPKASELLNGRHKIMFDFRENETQEDSGDDDADGTKKKKTTKKAPAAKKSKTVEEDTNAQIQPISLTNPGTKVKSSAKTKVADLSAEARIRLRCKNDLKALAARICTDKSVKNVNSIFTENMFKEMIVNMPQTRAELLKITYFTEAIFANYSGEEFLKIFQTYGKQLEDLKLIEEMEKFESNQTKSRKKASSDVFDDEGASGEQDWLSAKKGSASGYKRNAASSSSYGGTYKKRKTSGNSSSYFGGGTSQSSSAKKKFYKFKKYKKS